MKAREQNSTTKRIFAMLLAVWMSGVAFLFCCGAPSVQAANVESCPLAKKGHCAKPASGENALRFEIAQTEGAAFDCCGFLPQFFNKVRKTEKNQQIAETPAKTEIQSLPFAFVKVHSNTFFTRRPRPIDRSGAYLKNRVFRI